SFNDVVASFVDPDPTPNGPDKYSATIRWGDDGTLTAGLVVADPSGGPNHFLVKGAHVFGGGHSSVTVSVVDENGGSGTAASTADVLDSALHSEALRLDPEPVEGTPYAGALAR